MEATEKDLDPEVASGPSGSQDLQTSSFTEKSTVEVKGEVKESQNPSQEQDEEEEEGENLVTAERVIQLQREWKASVSLIQAIDVKESQQRAELEETHKLRCQQVALDAKNCQEHFEEISKGWEKTKQMVIPQDLQEALNKQEELCSTIIKDKKKLINELQQELKAADDRYIKDLRRQAEEIHLIMEKMEDQAKVLTNAYEEELSQMERVYQQECEVLLTKHNSEWADFMTRLMDLEIQNLDQRKTKINELEVEVRTLMAAGLDYTTDFQRRMIKSFQDPQKKLRHMVNAKLPLDLKLLRQQDTVEDNKIRLVRVSKRMKKLRTEFGEVKDMYFKQKDQFKSKNKRLSRKYQQAIELHERVQRKIKYFAATDAKKFKEMWLMIEGEVKQLVERVLDIDSFVSEQLLGLEWERPHMPFMEVTGPVQPKTQGDSLAPQLRASEEEELSPETLHKVVELLNDEAGHLVEEVVVKMFPPLDKTEQAVMELGSLLLALGIEEDDFPKLVHFLLTTNREQNKDDSSSSTREEQTSSEPLDPNCVIPTLQRFLQQLRREKLAHKHALVARDSSGDEAYWQSMANVIPEEKLKLWDDAESSLKQYHEILTEISELLPETQKLEQQNKELRQLLQQILYSPDTTEVEKPQ